MRGAQDPKACSQAVLRSRGARQTPMLANEASAASLLGHLGGSTPISGAAAQNGLFTNAPLGERGRWAKGQESRPDKAEPPRDRTGAATSEDTTARKSATLLQRQATRQPLLRGSPSCLFQMPDFTEATTCANRAWAGKWGARQLRWLCHSHPMLSSSSQRGAPPPHPCQSHITPGTGSAHLPACPSPKAGTLYCCIRSRYLLNQLLASVTLSCESWARDLG